MTNKYRITKLYRVTVPSSFSTKDLALELADRIEGLVLVDLETAEVVTFYGVWWVDITTPNTGALISRLEREIDF